MAPRSYLSRIAQPLVAGDPVLWSTPRPAADEARPAATTATSAPLQRKAAGAPKAQTPAATPSVVPAIISASPAAIDAMPLEPPAPVASQAAPDFEPIPTSHLDMDQAAPNPVAASPAEATASVRSVSPTPTAASPPDPTSDAFQAARAEPQVAPRPIRRAEPGAADLSSLTPAEIAPVSPAERAAAADRPDAPRLHIGTIEVRSSTLAPVAPPLPAPAQAAPSARSAASPIGRAYAWRFGLVQG